MPLRSLKPCQYPGCPNLIRSGRYCTEHAALDQRAQRAYDEQRGNAARRGYGYRWRRLRRLFLNEHPLCCDPFGIHTDQVIAATDVDHIVSRRMGGGDNEENLQALCHRCHSMKTAREDGRWGHG